MFDVSTIREALQINDNSKDTAIGLYIPAVADFVKSHCKNDFETVPQGLLLAFSLMIAHLLNKRFMQGVNSESLGDHSISTGLEFPPALLKMLAPYRKIKLV